jgi:hypothetical protein
VGGYRRLYQSLGLEFTHRVEKIIRESSSSENPAEGKRVHAFKLDSRANMSAWKKRLSQDEIRRIREMTEEIASIYYPEAQW